MKIFENFFGPKHIYFCSDFLTKTSPSAVSHLYHAPYKRLIYNRVSKTLQACSLDLKPQSSWSDQSYYENENQLKAVLSGGYVRLQEALGAGAIIYGSARSDEYICHNTTRIEIDNIVNNGITAWNSYASWAAFYRVIQQANLVLLHAPIMVEKGIIDEASGQQYIAEAYCMRAFTYFWIIRIWGDCPLKTKASIGDDNDKGMKRSPESEVRSRIHADLVEAEKFLADNGDRVHFTKTAAYAIEAQLCAWEQDWDGVIEANTHILGSNDYALAEFYNSNYTATMTITSDFYRYLSDCELVSLFNTGRNKESIFELSYSTEDNNNSASLYGLVGGNGETLRPRLKNLFIEKRLEGDWRFYLNFYSNNPRWTKYFINYSAVDLNTRNLVLLRLADFILLQAEANIEKIETAAASEKQEYLAEAIRLINLIRKRAGGDNLLLQASSFDISDIESIKSVVYNERLLELYGEGYRYFDLVRTGKVLEVMGPINGQTNPDSVVWPIYYPEILYGSGIEQNKYYM